MNATETNTPHQRQRRSLLLASLALWLTPAQARADNASCRSAALPAAPAPEAELFVLIDQTTVLPSAMRAEAVALVQQWLAPGRQVQVIEFSSFSQGRHTERVARFTLDAPLTQEQADDVPRSQLRRHAVCLAAQLPQIREDLATALNTSFSRATHALQHSDIVAGLSEIASLIRASKAGHTRVLLVSDMMEHSALASFYSGGSLMREGGQALAHRLMRQGWKADFGNSAWHVLGTGLMPAVAPASADSLAANGPKPTRRAAHDDARSPAPGMLTGQTDATGTEYRLQRVAAATTSRPSVSNTYRPANDMRALQQFWVEWLSQSRARVVEFGQPALLRALVD